MVTTFSRREIISSENGIICLSHTPHQRWRHRSKTIL